MATTLWEFYKGQLPSITERAKIFEQQGLGSASSYQGTAEQNTALLSKLQTQPVSGMPPQGPTSLVGPQTPQFPNLSPLTPNQEVLDIKKQVDDILAQVKEKQTLLEKAEASGFGVGTGKEIPSWVETAKSPEEAKAIAEAPISALKAEPRREERIGELESQVFQPPTQTWQDIYKKAYEQSGLEKTKTAIEAIDTKINKARDDLITAEQGITENPWLTESGRVGRIKTLYEMAERTISNLVTQREQQWNFYQEGIRQAENVATRTQAETEVGRKLKAEELDYLNSLRQTEGTPQLKQLATGEYAWMYPSGKVVKTGELAELAKPEAEPTSYREWELAGKPGTYQEWLKSRQQITQGQYSTATYANRIEQAETIFTQLEDYVKSLSSIELMTQKKLPEALKSDKFKSLEQAQRNFVNAVLRRESGAAISPSEFENAEKQYFPQPGDSAANLAQKKRNRDIVLQGFIREAGGAYTSATIEKTITAPDGSVWRENNDGTLTQIK